MVQCPNGHDNPDGAKFCNECGAAIAAAESPATPAGTAAPEFAAPGGPTAADDATLVTRMAPPRPPSGATTRPPSRTFWKRPAGIAVIVVAALLLLGGVGAALGLGDEEPSPADGTDVAEEVSGTPSVEPEATESPTPPPSVSEPDGTYTTSCDYLLGNFTATQRGYRAIAAAKIRNTGNVGIVLDVTARWDITGRPSLRVTKTVHVPYDGFKKVDFSEVLTSDELDAMQEAALSFDNWCGVKATITDSYGTVH